MSTTTDIRRNFGFTLIEVMIAIVIVGILSAISYPAYREHIRQGHETEAQGQIMELASALEAYRAKNFSYDGAAVPALSPRLQANRHYSTVLNINNSGQSFSITATPSSALMSGMPILTLNSLGNASWE